MVPHRSTQPPITLQTPASPGQSGCSGPGLREGARAGLCPSRHRGGLCVLCLHKLSFKLLSCFNSSRGCEALRVLKHPGSKKSHQLLCALPSAWEEELSSTRRAAGEMWEDFPLLQVKEKHQAPNCDPSSRGGSRPFRNGEWKRLYSHPSNWSVQVQNSSWERSFCRDYIKCRADDLSCECFMRRDSNLISSLRKEPPKAS
ncbi:uncharacterized protein LOC120322647 [Pipra filicauda]|uniref:Uncharacterized protein LOC120322647 n=1 Tax=Pipra filicauda TaxID=649802 RepID=A0A7R5K4I4_9PASS|nr:uncharacterized protein LOC120322647 [Pipra filicauda]